jgi:hypothetical protein
MFSVVMTAQETSNYVEGFKVFQQPPSAHVVVNTSGPVVLEVWDEHDKLLVTVYRDGHIEADKKDLDEAAKTFWEVMAKYAINCDMVNTIKANNPESPHAH